MNDDPSVIRSTPSTSLGFNITNLPTLDTPRRVERLVPPMGFWNTYGISMLFYLINIILLFFYKNIFSFKFKIQIVGNKN